jgi:hypothetical protein
VIPAPPPYRHPADRVEAPALRNFSGISQRPIKDLRKRCGQLADLPAPPTTIAASAFPSGSKIMSNSLTRLLYAGLASAAAMWVIVAPASAETLANDYRFTIVDFPGAPQTNVIAINDLRQYVGVSIDASGANHAIFFDGHKLAALDPGGIVGKSVNSFALSLNNFGCIAGTYQDGSAFHGFVDCNGQVRKIDFPGATTTEAFGINDFGEVIGLYVDTAQNVHAFWLRDGKFKTDDIPGAVETVPFSVNDRGDIVGEDVAIAGTNGHGYIEDPFGHRQIVDAPGAPANSTFFISINNELQILGAFADAAGVQHNFLVDGGKFLPFDLPAHFGSSFTSAQTINDRDDIVGFFNDSTGVAHGFVALRDR